MIHCGAATRTNSLTHSADFAATSVRASTHVVARRPYVNDRENYVQF